MQVEPIKASFYAHLCRSGPFSGISGNLKLIILGPTRASRQQGAVFFWKSMPYGPEFMD